MKRFPMMVQLVVILFIVMAVPMTVLTFYSNGSILRSSEDVIASSSMASLNASRKLNENALGYLAQNAVTLASTGVFDRIRNFESFSGLNEKYSNMSNALAVLRELHNLNHRVDGVESTFFYLEGADYVISTDKGITMLERYESLDWIDQALEEQTGVSGVWQPRRLNSGTPVLTYIYPLNRLTTTTRGAIVINLKESQIGRYLESSEQGEQGYLLMNTNGTIISHHDKSLLLSDAGELPLMGDLLNHSPKREGYAFYEQDGKRLLYTWSPSKLFNWWNVQIYSVDQLMTASFKLQKQIMWSTALIILIGTIFAVPLATWLSKPIRKLVRNIRANANLGMSGKNEMAFLSDAFNRMQEEEGALYKLLEERERDTHSLAVHKLMRGESTKRTRTVFPERYYTVAMISIDHYERYVSKNNPETRSYHRHLLTSQCESLFSTDMIGRCQYQGRGTFVLILNYGQQEADRNLSGVKEGLEAISGRIPELLGHSVTIGVGGQTDSPQMIPEKLIEGAEAIKRRMTKGLGCIFYWEQEADQNKRFIYPDNSEQRILNYLDSGDLNQILKELKELRNDIQSADSVAYDNILFIYNQLVGVVIKHLRENNIHTARFFAGRDNIYSAISSIDTLDELETHLEAFFTDIVNDLSRNKREANHGQKIIDYLEAHYREEIVFEEMAKEIGISYSYMRKIVFETTGKSLIDYMNALRINEAKNMLLATEKTMTQISSEVGYANIQSFNRFFRKFEGMPPSSYKTAKAGETG